jgi:hypothetical protein
MSAIDEERSIKMSAKGPFDSYMPRERNISIQARINNLALAIKSDIRKADVVKRDAVKNAHIVRIRKLLLKISQ